MKKATMRHIPPDKVSFEGSVHPKYKKKVFYIVICSQWWHSGRRGGGRGVGGGCTCRWHRHAGGCGAGETTKNTIGTNRQPFDRHKLLHWPLSWEDWHWETQTKQHTHPVSGWKCPHYTSRGLRLQKCEKQPTYTLFDLFIKNKQRSVWKVRVVLCIIPDRWRMRMHCRGLKCHWISNIKVKSCL